MLQKGSWCYLTYAKKQRSQSISRNLAENCDFWWITNSILKKEISTIPSLLNGSEKLFSESDKTKLIAENFFKNSKLDNLFIFERSFPSRTTLKQHHTPVILKLVLKFITNHDLSKVSGPDCTPAVVLESFEPELFYIIAELSYIIAKILNVCLKKFFFFHIFGWSYPWFLNLKMFGRGL